MKSVKCISPREMMRTMLWAYHMTSSECIVTEVADVTTFGEEEAAVTRAHIWWLGSYQPLTKTDT